MPKGRTAASRNSTDRAAPALALVNLVARAVALHQEGKLPEAEALYRDVLTVDPRHPDALHLLGVIAHQCGQSVPALALMEKAIAEKPREPTFHYSAALALQALRRGDDAIGHFKRALALKPDFGPAAVNLGLSYLLAGRADDAANAATAALAIAETADARQLFVEALGLAREPARLTPSRLTAVRALRERWTRPDNLARSISRVVAESGPLAKAVKSANDAWPRLLPAGELDLPRAQSDDLLQTLLVSTRVCSIELERYLTNVRAALLGLTVSSADEDTALLPLACALARQCFINEYVFHVGEAEEAQAGRLTESLAQALERGEEIAPLRVAVAAAYIQLDAFLPADTLLARQWTSPVNDVVVQQVREPATERQLRAAIPRLTPIEDDVSRAVQQQYEHHPYPRWAAATAAVPDGAPFDDAREILVAGCGTGRQVIEMAFRNKAARFLAVDLSLASLSYAMRKARELGVSNVEFAQADLLELGAIGRTFDFIDSSGVLHHLRDPWAGWRVLASLLRPGRTMRVALYSELARRPLAPARAFIVEGGYSGSTEDIRRFRQDVLRAPRLATLARSNDFYTVSSCRDLLFHVQEQRMTIPEIAAFLAEIGLEFVRFDVTTVAIEAFRSRFPDPSCERNLACWHAFEQENPALFVGMYQFDVRKP